MKKRNHSSDKNHFFVNHFLKNYIWILLIFLGITFFIYRKAFGGYFQGDEWFYFTQFLPLTHIQGGLMSALSKSIFSVDEISGGGHLTPLYTLIWYLHNKYFGLNFFPYITLSIFFHALNGFLLFHIVKKMTKNMAISFLAGFFFIFSYQNFQAVTWIMAYVPTVYAVFFTLVSFLYLLYALEISKKVKVYTFLSVIFLILALLTKETSIVLFLVFPIIVLLFKKSLFRKFGFIYTSLFILYGVFRFGIPLFQKGSALTQFSEVYTLPLFIFRMITYPLKVLVSIFFPHELLLKIAEVLTPFAYPFYGAEKSVRGTNFLMFTQTAGSDLLIYTLSVILFFTLVFFFFLTLKYKNINYLLIIGSLIAVLSAFPLLLIALYAPAWGYVTFIDSRHLYFPSVGAAMIFSGIIFVVYKKRNQIPRLSQNFVIFFIASALIVWTGIQYTYLQKQLGKEEVMGQQRQIVLKGILSSVPQLSQKAFFLVESNTGYYGFAPMPPFQTHLSQVLSIQYYQRGQLPVVFVRDYSLVNRGLGAEGTLHHGNREFGYFINQSTFFAHLLDRRVDSQNIYSFKWDGNNNRLTDVTGEIRGKYEDLQVKLNNFLDWKKITWKDANLQFSIPPDATLITESVIQPNVINQASIFTPSQKYQIILWKKTLNIGIFEDISHMVNSNGETIGDNFYYRDVVMFNGDKVITKIASKGDSMDYFIPTIIPDVIIEVRVIGRTSEVNKSDELAETIISHMKSLK